MSDHNARMAAVAQAIAKRNEQLELTGPGRSMFSETRSITTVDNNGKRLEAAGVHEALAQS